MHPSLKATKEGGNTEERDWEAEKKDGDVP